MIGAAGFQIFGSVGQYLSGQMAAESRQMEFKDRIRQLTLKKDYTVGLATAKSAASETDMTSASTVDYLKKLTTEFDTEIANTKKLAGMVGNADWMGNFSQLFGGLGGAAGSYAKANGY